jgi:hypothetical protein
LLTECRDVLIVALSFALLLRHDECVNINCMHMSNEKAGVRFLIPISKTDPLRKGNMLFLSRQESPESIFQLLLVYMKLAGMLFGENKFLFCEIEFRNHSEVPMIHINLTYDEHLKIFKQKIASLGLDASQYGTHSARSGGASELADKITKFELMTSGRWRDERSLRNYVEINEKRRWQISQQLTKL